MLVVLIASHSVGADFIALPDGTVTGRGIPGSLVTLSSVAGQGEDETDLVLTTRVNSRGFYFFMDIDPGQYLITFTPPPGYTAIPSFPET